MLRISAVVESESMDAERMTYKTAQGEQLVWVSKKAIITEKDVKNAYPDPMRKQTIDIQLTEKGGAAMIAATSPMRPGRDRMAVIIEGKLHSAPVLNSVPLGASFFIEGLTEFDDRQLANLVRGMMGQRPLGPHEAVPTPPPAMPRPPLPKQVPYTEEEMKALKVQREQFGIYQLDRIPDEAELNKTLHRGMTADEVIALFGKPIRHKRKPDSKDFYLAYEIAPYRRLGRSDEMHPDGFKVEFRDDKVVSWSTSSWNDTPREMKTERRAPGLLKAILPKIDMSAENVSFVAWAEGIRIPDLNQPVTTVDLSSLLSLLYSSAVTVGANKNASIRADCDVLKLLAKYLPDFAKLTSAAKDGKVPIQDLRAAVEPFCRGEKPIPDPKAPCQQSN
jgi:hypothetical protein